MPFSWTIWDGKAMTVIIEEGEDGFVEDDLDNNSLKNLIKYWG